MTKYEHVFHGWDEGYEAGKRAGMARAASIAERAAGERGMVVFSGKIIPNVLMLHVRDQILAELERGNVRPDE